MLFGLFAILPFTVCLFWMMVLLLDWKRDNAAQHVLAAFMGTAAMLYLCHAVFFYHETSWLSVSECIYAFCNIAVFPLYYLYIYRLTDRRGLSIRHLWVLLPAVAIGIWTVILNVFYPSDTYAENLRIMVMRILFLLQLVPVCYSCYRRLYAFDTEIAENYADTDTRSVRPTTRTMWLLVVAALISGVSNLIGREYFDSNNMLISIPSILFTAVLFGVGYVGKRQEFCIDDLLREEMRYSLTGIKENAYTCASDRDPSTPQSMKEKPEDTLQVIVRLEKLMSEESLFLHPDLRLAEVASKLGVGRTTLSQRINNELHISFSDYVNKKRVAYACQRLSESDFSRISLAQLAEICGFSSTSSFYRVFRQHMGMTPKQFVENR